MNTLTEIANRLGTDKGTLSYGHGYTEYYHELFIPFIGKTVVNLLEIGIADPRFPGASVNMWKEYFPSLYFVGMDINPEAKKFTSENINIFIGDQGSRLDLAECMFQYGKEFDIIIDDGSHHEKHILTSLEVLLPYVGPGGYYIIEDLHSIYSNANSLLPAIDEMLKNVKDLEPLQHKFNNKLLVIKKAL